jgi:hypothetical protein
MFSKCERFIQWWKPDRVKTGYVERKLKTKDTPKTPQRFINFSLEQYHSSQKDY